jgi:hypothetical protein
MSSRTPFTQANLTRALKGAQKAGLKVDRVEIKPSGEFVLFSSDPPSDSATELDAWRAKRNARPA